MNRFTLKGISKYSYSLSSSPKIESKVVLPDPLSPVMNTKSPCRISSDSFKRMSKIFRCCPSKRMVFGDFSKFEHARSLLCHGYGKFTSGNQTKYPSMLHQYCDRLSVDFAGYQLNAFGRRQFGNLAGLFIQQRRPALRMNSPILEIITDGGLSNLLCALNACACDALTTSIHTFCPKPVLQRLPSLFIFPPIS